MKRQVMLCGEPRTLENNALLPRKYRHIFGRDLMVDMQKMVDDYAKSPENCSLEVLENVSWLMLKEGGENVGESPEEWLAGIGDTFAVYDVMNDVVDLWSAGRKTTSKPKKK